jgi:prophage regulatory protein
MTERDKSMLSILRRKQVEVRIGLSRSTIYARVKDGTFPPFISLGAKAVGWLQSDIEHWISNQIRASRSYRPEQTPHRPGRPRKLPAQDSPRAVLAAVKHEKRHRRPRAK